MPKNNEKYLMSHLIGLVMHESCDDEHIINNDCMCS